MTAADYPDDPQLVDKHTRHTEGGRYGWRDWRYPDGRMAREYWGSRIETWGARQFATLDEAERYVNTRDEPHDSFGTKRRP